MSSCTHDLHAGSDRGVSFLGLADDVVKHSVDAETNDEFLFERLDVNIRGLFFDRAENQRVHELDDRRVVLSGFQDIDRPFEVIGVLELPFDLFYEVSRIALINSVDRVLDTHAGADDDLHGHSGQRLQVIHHDLIEGIGNGHDESHHVRLPSFLCRSE